jgi:acetyl esterase/lipase
MIHGGGFTLGESVHVPYNQVNYLLDNGVAVCSIGYRLLPQYVVEILPTTTEDRLLMIF